MTGIGLLHRAATARLRDAGIDGAALDARLLLHAAAGTRDADLIARSGMDIGDAAARRLDAMVQRRLAREPVARILGFKEFWGLELEVGPAVLVPRPETETIVEAALAAFNGRRGDPLAICDLGTGSGALIAVLLVAFANARGTAVDISGEALAVARRNADRHGVAGRLELLHGDFANYHGGPFDLVVSNPPYVASGDIESLAPDVAAHDPRLALDGGPDGLDAYRVIAPRLGALLKPDGLALLEVEGGQADAVRAILAAQGLAVGADRADLAGIARVVSAGGSNCNTVNTAGRTAKKALGNGRQSG